MTADLDLSPEAVERLAEWCAIHDMRATGSRTAATLRALSAENTRLTAENERLFNAGEALMQEKHKEANEAKLWFETCMRERQEHAAALAEDEASAHDIARLKDSETHWMNEADRLRAERDAAWQAGAEAVLAEIEHDILAFGRNNW